MTIMSFRNTPLSNMYLCDVEWCGNIFKSVEHAYMSAKSLDESWVEFCLKTASPYDVKKQSRKVTLREDWEDIKDDVMWELLWKKWNIPTLKEYLLSAGDEELVEGNTWKDTYWGYDTNLQHGENRLGFYIMEIRKIIRGRS